MNHVTSQGLTPRMRPLSSRKSATLSILDIGTSKVVCLIAELSPAETNERLRGRTHVARIIGIGHQRSLGLKGGAIVCRMGARIRRGEELAITRTLAKIGVPILRTGRALGVLVVQNRASRTYREDEVEALETTAMVIAEMVATGELKKLTKPGLELDLSRPVAIEGSSFGEGIASQQICRALTMLRLIGPVRTSPSAWRGEATISMP